MRPLSIRRCLDRRRRRLAAVVGVLACAGMLAGHHNLMASGVAPDDMGMSTALEMCVTVLTALGATVLALGIVPLGRSRPPLRLLVAGPETDPATPASSARAGPALLLLLCISRR